MIKRWPHLDIWIASAGVLAGLLLLALAYTIAPDQYGISIAILVTSGSYLLFRKPPAVSEREQPHLGRGIQLLPWVVRISTGCTALLAAVAFGSFLQFPGAPCLDHHRALHCPGLHSVAGLAHSKAVEGA